MKEVMLMIEQIIIGVVVGLIVLAIEQFLK